MHHSDHVLKFRKYISVQRKRTILCTELKFKSLNSMPDNSFNRFKVDGSSSFEGKLDITSVTS